MSKIKLKKCKNKTYIFIQNIFLLNFIFDGSLKSCCSRKVHTFFVMHTKTARVYTHSCYQSSQDGYHFQFKTVFIIIPKQTINLVKFVIAIFTTPLL